jgi:hypothetical protein
MVSGDILSHLVGRGPEVESHGPPLFNIWLQRFLAYLINMADFG